MLPPLVPYIVIPVAVVVLVLYLLHFAYQRRSGRRMFFESQMEMADSDFLAAVDVSEEDAMLALAIRRAIAKQCDVPATLILPDDRPHDLHEWMLWTGWDEIDFLVQVSNELDQWLTKHHTCLPQFTGLRFPRREGPSTLGAWIVQAIPEIKKNLVPRQPGAVVCGAKRSNHDDASYVERT